MATGRPLPKLVVDTPKATPILLKGKLSAKGTLSGNLQNFDTRGALGAENIDVHGNSARLLLGRYAWTNARTPASTIALGLIGDSISAMGFQFDSLDARVSYRGQTGGGAVQVLVRQGDQRDYGLKGDYVVNADRRELRIADMELRFDTTLWRATHLPVNLALSGVTGSRLLPQPLTVDLKADSLPLELIPAFTGVVTDVHGRAGGQVAVRGTFDRPSIAGGLILNQGAVRLASSGMLLENVTGTVRMANDSVRIDSLAAKAGRGTVALTGGLAVGTWRDPAFNLFFVAHNAEVLNNEHGTIEVRSGALVPTPPTPPAPPKGQHANPPEPPEPTEN